MTCVIGVQLQYEADLSLKQEAQTTLSSILVMNPDVDQFAQVQIHYGI